MSFKRFFQRVLGTTPEPSGDAPAPHGDFVCTFCGLPAAQVVALIEAPERRAYICDQCVDTCLEVLRERGHRDRVCAFCATPQADAALLFEGPHGNLICDQCVAFCVEHIDARRDAATTPSAHEGGDSEGDGADSAQDQDA